MGAGAGECSGAGAGGGACAGAGAGGVVESSCFTSPDFRLSFENGFHFERLGEPGFVASVLAGMIDWNSIDREVLNRVMLERREITRGTNGRMSHK